MAQMMDPKMKWQYAKAVEENLVAALKYKSEAPPSFEEIDRLIKGMRMACQDAIFMDIQYAANEDIETHLWNAHILLKTRFKGLVEHYRQNVRGKIVERRKYEKRYVDYIKETRYFYTGYIQRLASHFGGIPGLNRVADCMALHTQSVDEPSATSAHIKKLVAESCHECLLHLGDLARYRNEIRVMDDVRSWDPAIGYYELAASFCPDSGKAYNQLAVIAKADQNHLNALYHLYRAIAIKEPHPLAASNLDVEFKKITTLWEKSPISRAKADDDSTLTLWFVRLHARLSKGVVFTGHNELENEVLSRLALVIKKDSFDDLWQKLVIINIAAGYYSEERVKEQDSEASPEAIQSFFFFLRFNIRFLHVLLQALYPEIENSATGQDLPNSADEAKAEKGMFTAVARRVLPAIRQYSTWLVSKSKIVINVADNKETNLHLYFRHTWSLYAEVLSRIAQGFPTAELPTINYLQHEDVHTIGFKPFRDPDLPRGSDLYVDSKSELKPRLGDEGITQASPDTEMLSRVRDILLCALNLQLMENCPIKLLPGTSQFIYIENDPSVMAHAANMQTINASIPSTTSPDADPSSCQITPEDSASNVQPNFPVKMESGVNMATYMHDMVDSLVDNSRNQRISNADNSRSQRTVNETSYDMHTRTANEIFAPMTSNANGVYTHQGTPKMLPSLSGIWQTPFTPQPNELKPTSPERSSVSRMPFQYNSQERQAAAADALDAMTGHPSSSRRTDPWGQSVRSSGSEQPITHQLHDGVSPRYYHSQSSEFTDNSSVYGNPTPARYAHQPIGTRNGAFAPTTGYNNTAAYPGPSSFDRSTMLNSSIWNGTQRTQGGYNYTPPGGQG